MKLDISVPYSSPSLFWLKISSDQTLHEHYSVSDVCDSILSEKPEETI